MQLSTDLFIDQCRFNPQHDAPTEQLLYNALPAWLAADASSGSLMLELSADGAVHNAKLPYESLVASLAPIRQRLLEQLNAMLSRAPNAQIVLCSTLSELPGLAAQLDPIAPVTTIDAEQHLASSLTHSEQILSAGASSLRKTLALSRPASTLSPKAGTASATQRAAENAIARFGVSAQGVQAATLLSSLRVNGERVANAAELTLKEGDSLTLGIDSETGGHNETQDTLTFTLKKLSNGED